MRFLGLIDRAGVGVLVLLIRSYKILLAPLWIGGCRHWPTCSDFAVGALRVHGVKRGGLMAIRRIVSCRPGGSFGYDPVEHGK